MDWNTIALWAIAAAFILGGALGWWVLRDANAAQEPAPTTRPVEEPRPTKPNRKTRA